MKKMKCLDRFKNSPKYGAGEIADYITSRCTDAEMLSVLFELNRRMQKRVESISDQCHYTTNEGTPDEDYELDEEQYNSELAKLQQEAKEILVNELSWGISEDGWNPDLFEELGIEV
mgnify:FL=1